MVNPAAEHHPAEMQAHKNISISSSTLFTICGPRGFWFFSVVKMITKKKIMFKVDSGPQGSTAKDTHARKEFPKLS